MDVTQHTDVAAFMNLLYSQVDRGIYVWGGNGQNLSAMDKPEAWIERHETSAKNAARAVKLYRTRVEDGVTEIRAFDCSGLVYWALHKLGLQKSDVSSRGLYSLCEKIQKADLRPGDLVFHHDGKQIVHVGVYIGTNRYIECRGRDYGVVCNTRSSGYWNRFGRWKAFVDKPEPEPATVVYVKGGSVNVRSVDHVPKDKKQKESTIIGIAHRGETYPLIKIAPSGWYNINFRGQLGYISNRPDLTEVRNA